MTDITADQPSAQALVCIEQACSDVMLAINNQVHHCGLVGELEALDLLVRAVSNLHDRVVFKQKHGIGYNIKDLH